MMDPKTCNHTTLRFLSGDYYLNCPDCGMTWMLRSPNKPEYGIDIHDRHVGGDHEGANQGMPMGGQVRVAPDGNIKSAPTPTPGSILVKDEPHGLHAQNPTSWEEATKKAKK